LDPDVDYRRIGAANERLGFSNIISRSPSDYFDFDALTLSGSVQYNFPPGDSQRTISSIGIGLYESEDKRYLQDFASFISLSVPITQDVNQYLYIKYTIFIDFKITSPEYFSNNSFISYYLRRGSAYGSLLSLGVAWTGGSGTVTGVLSQFTPPSDINKMARGVTEPQIFGYTSSGQGYYQYVPQAELAYVKSYELDLFSSVSTKVSGSFGTSSFYGPIGSFSFLNYYGPYPGDYVHNDFLKVTTPSDDNLQEMLITGGYSPIPLNAPSISRVFVHPYDRRSEIFSDPEYPPSSRGSISVSGTPTNKWPIVARVKITKTGDASDIIDETVSFSSVDTVANEIGVSQDWGQSGDIIRIAGSDLPSPLLQDVDYFVNYVNSNTIRISSTYNESISDIVIDLVSQGSGSFIISRQNTGTYQYELEGHLSGTEYRNLSVFPLPQLKMAIDANDKKMPSWMVSPNSAGEGGVSSPYSTSSVFNFLDATEIYQQAHIGEYVYTIQRSRIGFYLNICKWLQNTLETSEALYQIGDSGAKCTALVVIGSKFYISVYEGNSTTNGLWTWDTDAQEIAPSKLNIGGIIDEDITDLAYDSVTGFLWSGHTTGLCRIDLGTSTATKYLNSTEGELEGLTATDVNISPGQLSARNGHVLRSGQVLIRFDLGTRTEDRSIWLLKDGVGFYKIMTKGVGATISRDGKIVVNTLKKWRDYTVVVTGKNEGSASIDQEQDTGLTLNSTYTSWIKCQTVEVNENQFYSLFTGTDTTTATSVSNLFISFYNKVDNSISWASRTYSYTTLVYSAEQSKFGASRNVIKFNDNLNILSTMGFLFKTTIGRSVATYGWDGSSWSVGETGSKKITKTGVDNLPDGISLQFNNASGQTWNTQFVETERFTYMYAPCFIKDNLQTLTVKSKMYFSEVVSITDWTSELPGDASGLYTVVIPEAESDPNFRDLDSDELTMRVFINDVEYTKQANSKFTSTSTSSSVDYIAIGSGTVLNDGDYLCQDFRNTESSYYISQIHSLIPGKAYVAYRISSTQTKLKNRASDVNYIRIPYIPGAFTFTKYVPPQTQGTYNALPNGTIQINLNDGEGGKDLKISYTYIKLN